MAGLCVLVVAWWLGSAVLSLVGGARWLWWLDLLVLAKLRAWLRRH